MKTRQVTFRELLLSFSPKYDLHRVFQDFLNMCLCAFAINPLTGQSYYEDEYSGIIRKYESIHQQRFSEMLVRLVLEMEKTIMDGISKDILGEVYQELFYKPRSGQFFTPEHITDLMAAITTNESKEVLSVLDSCCGSGRMLLSSAKAIGKHHHFYGIDIDLTCVQMTAINLFLNGIFNAEIMCADALKSNDFRISYRTSFLPFGIFRIEQHVQSQLWNKLQISKNTTGDSIEIDLGKQLQLF